MTDDLRGLSGLLDRLLAVGKEYAAKGQDLAEDQLDIPEDGVERDAMVSGLKKGALASAVLVGLLGTKTGRSLTGTALKIGGLAALGTAAFKGYRNWQETGSPLGTDDGGEPVHQLSDSRANTRSMLILKAMVAAAHADGHVDNQEIQTIRHELIEMHLPQSLAEEVESILDSPNSARQLASLVTTQQIASEVYLASRLIIGKDSSAQEQGYLQDLVQALGLADELKNSLDQQVT